MNSSDSVKLPGAVVRYKNTLCGKFYTLQKAKNLTSLYMCSVAWWHFGFQNYIQYTPAETLTFPTTSTTRHFLAQSSHSHRFRSHAFITLSSSWLINLFSLKERLDIRIYDSGRYDIGVISLKKEAIVGYNNFVHAGRCSCRSSAR